MPDSYLIDFLEGGMMRSNTTAKNDCKGPVDDRDFNENYVLEGVSGREKADASGEGGM